MMVAVWNSSMTTRKWFIMNLVTDVSPDTTKPTRQIWIRDVLVCGWHTWPPQDSPPAATWSNQKRSEGPPRAMRLGTSNESHEAEWKNLTLFFGPFTHVSKLGLNFSNMPAPSRRFTPCDAIWWPMFFKGLHHMWNSKPGLLLLLCQFCKSASCDWTPAQHDTSSLSSYISQPIDLRHATVCACVFVHCGL